MGGEYRESFRMRKCREMLEQAKADVETIVRALPLRQVVLPARPFSKFLKLFEQRFSFGGSRLVAFEVGEEQSLRPLCCEREIGKRRPDGFAVIPASGRGGAF